MAGILEKAAEGDWTTSASALLLFLGYIVANFGGTRSTPSVLSQLLPKYVARTAVFAVRVFSRHDVTNGCRVASVSRRIKVAAAFPPKFLHHRAPASSAYQVDGGKTADRNPGGPRYTSV